MICIFNFKKYNYIEYELERKEKVMGLFSRLFSKEEKVKKPEVIPYKNSNQIVIGLSDTSDSVTEYKKESNETEETVCTYIMRKMTENRDPKHKFVIQHKSDNYTTLVYRNIDLVRVKWTPQAKWIAIYMGSKEMSDKYKDDPRFIEQSNKNQIQWRTGCLDENDLEDRIPIILESFDSIENYAPENNLSDMEKMYAVAAIKVMAEVTGDMENIYSHKKTGGFSIMYYCSTAMMFEIKTYKKKPNRFMCRFDEAKNHSLYSGKESAFPDYLEFTDTSFFETIKPIAEDRYEKFNSWREGYITSGESFSEYCSKASELL